MTESTSFAASPRGRRSRLPLAMLCWLAATLAAGCEFDINGPPDAFVVVEEDSSARIPGLDGVSIRVGEIHFISIDVDTDEPGDDDIDTHLQSDAHEVEIVDLDGRVLAREAIVVVGTEIDFNFDGFHDVEVVDIRTFLLEEDELELAFWH